MSATRTAVVSIVFLAGFVTGHAQTNRRYVASALASNPAAPAFSGAVQIGETLYLSGHLGLGPDDRARPDTPQAEAENVLGAIAQTLQSAGFSMDDLVYVQVFCPDVSNYQAFNAVYRTKFKAELPARAFVGSGPLLFGARFEVQGIAVRR